MDKKSIEEVAEIVEMEGLGYAIQSYLSSENIEDPELAEVWEEATMALAEIEELLSKYNSY